MNILNITLVCCGSWLNIAPFVWFQRTTPEQTSKSSGKIQPVRSELSRLTCPSVDLVGNQPSRYIIPLLYGPVTHPGGSWSASCIGRQGHRSQVGRGGKRCGEILDPRLVHAKSHDFRVIPPFKDYEHQKIQAPRNANLFSTRDLIG